MQQPGSGGGTFLREGVGVWGVGEIGSGGAGRRVGWWEELGMTGRLDDVNILIVDDDQDILDTFDAALQAEGATTTAVNDGNAAVASVQENPPDIVVLDMMLPKRSGFLVLEKIKGFEDSPLVIMVTANEGKRHQAYAESLGVDAYLQKPVPLEQLIETCVQLLDREAAEDGVE